MLWLTSALSGAAWANTDTTHNYYTWAGWGYLCAYGRSIYLQPGIYGDTWTAASVDWENGGANCNNLYTPNHEHGAQVWVWHYVGGLGYVICNNIATPSTIDPNPTSSVAGGSSSINNCNFAGQKYVDAEAAVNWDGAWREYGLGFLDG
jgi:hypothetical protein